MYLICFYVPVDSVQSVKLSMFNAGAGQSGCYDYCCFETLGYGQFRPGAKAKPFIGKIDEIEIVKEVKVEMICDKNIIEKVIMALKEAHPYETPAYHVLDCLNF